MIRHAKRKYFSDTADNCKNTKAIWKHLRSVKTGTNLSTNQLPAELVINNEHILDSTKVASKLNEFFASVADQFEMDSSDISITPYNTSDPILNCSSMRDLIIYNKITFRPRIYRHFDHQVVFLKITNLL